MTLKKLEEDREGTGHPAPPSDRAWLEHAPIAKALHELKNEEDIILPLMRLRNFFLKGRKKKFKKGGSLEKRNEGCEM